MSVLFELSVFIFSFLFMPNFIENENYFCIAVSIIAIIISYNYLKKRINRFLYGKYVYDINKSIYNDYSRYMPKHNTIPYSYSEFKETNYDDVAKKCIINKERVEIISSNSNDSSKVIPVNKTEKKKEPIIDDRSIIYESFIEVISRKKYGKSKTCRLLNSIKNIKLDGDNLKIYYDDSDFYEMDVFPFGDIEDKIKSYLHKIHLKIEIINLKNNSLLTYYINKEKLNGNKI